MDDTGKCKGFKAIELPKNNMKNILYFINSDSGKYLASSVNLAKLRDSELLRMSDYVIEDNIYVKHRQGGVNVKLSDDEIFNLIQKYNGLIISQPIKLDKISKSLVISYVNKYLNIQETKLDPLIDKIAHELKIMYPSMRKQELIDWALEFINTNGKCDDVFNRLNSLYPIPIPLNYLDVGQ